MAFLNNLFLTFLVLILVSCLDVPRNDGDFYTDIDEVTSQYEVHQAEAEAMNRQLEELKEGQSSRVITDPMEQVKADVAKINAESEAMTNSLSLPTSKQARDPYFSEKEISEMMSLYNSQKGKKLLESSSKTTNDIVNKFIVEKQAAGE